MLHCLRTATAAAAFVFAILTALTLATGPASAGSATIGGARMNCHAADVYVGGDVPGPGFAVKGTILLGPQYLKKYPSTTQRLIFLHECAHQYVGADETAADCWAVRIAKRQGWLTPAGINSTCKALWHTAGGVYHLPGPQRCAALRECYASAPGRKTRTARKRKKK
ncbi:MAG: hypothetical protein R3D33_12235 [Hyphomicrobiaceae bacterium]